MQVGVIGLGRKGTNIDVIIDHRIIGGCRYTGRPTHFERQAGAAKGSAKY
jgi:hypothetical protein